MPGTSSSTSAPRKTTAAQPRPSSAGKTPQARSTEGAAGAPRSASRNRTVAHVPAQPDINSAPKSAFVGTARGKYARHQGPGFEGMALSAREIGEPQHTPQQLANLSARREFRDKLIEAYGEAAVAAAVRNVGLELKGAGKFAPLDENKRRRLDLAAQAHHAGLKALRNLHNGLIVMEARSELGIYTEALNNEIQAHPKYGKARFGKTQSRNIAYDASTDVYQLRRRLDREVAVEEFLLPQMGHEDGSGPAPSSFDQAVAEYERSSLHWLVLSAEEKIQLKSEFRSAAKIDPGMLDFGRIFVEQTATRYLDKRLDARIVFVIKAMSRLLPRELAGEIAATLRAITRDPLSRVIWKVDNRGA